MSHVFKVLGWLKAIDGHMHLNHEDRQRIREIGRLGFFSPRIEPILDCLRQRGSGAANPLRRAELFLYCAAIENERGGFPQAARDAVEGLVSYDHDSHRQAVAHWMLGIQQWEMSQNHEAYRNWAEARKIFKDCRGSFRHTPGKKNWYEDRIREMDVEMVAQPEEVVSWLNRFDSPSLGPQTRLVVNRLRERTRQCRYSSLHAFVQDFQEANHWSTGFYETAEIHLEFGLALYQLGNKHAATEFVRKAVRNFYTGFGSYHKLAVARCLLGAIEWMQELSRKQAAADWMRCLAEFENLGTQADSQNLSGTKEWYSERCDVLRSALLERVRPATPWEPADDPRDIPDEDQPRPSPSWHHPGKTNLYDELLSKVQWDRAIADRLIEYEIKMAPAVERNELIWRAIERWIRDNQ